MRAPLRFSTTTGRRQAHEKLERIVYEPLQACEGTNHTWRLVSRVLNLVSNRQKSNSHNPDRQPVPQTHKANLVVYATHRCTERLSRSSICVQLADHNIGWVRNNGAKNTSKVATSERDSCLGALAVVSLLAWQVVVDCCDNGLERGKFHHCVWNLSAPKRIETFVETASISQLNIGIPREWLLTLQCPPSQ
jgi:hypothetical protein